MRQPKRKPRLTRSGRKPMRWCGVISWLSRQVRCNISIQICPLLMTWWGSSKKCWRSKLCCQTSCYEKIDERKYDWRNISSRSYSEDEESFEWTGDLGSWDWWGNLGGYCLCQSLFHNFTWITIWISTRILWRNCLRNSSFWRSH